MLPQQKMYVVVRGDIPVGHQMAQSNHAAFRFAVFHPDLTKEWMFYSEYICILATRNGQQLEEYLQRAVDLGLKVAPFTEPDMGNELTAFALEPSPEATFLVSKLKLAGRK